MRSKFLLAALLLSGAAAWAESTSSPVVLTTPNEYYISCISPNGKWACGVFVDFSDSKYGFKWNLESGEIEMLNSSITSTPNYISNDGTIVGSYTDYTYAKNGAAKHVPGYWKDGKWNRFELPEDGVDDAAASYVTADGHYVAGWIQKDTWSYEGVVWKDGKIDREITSQYSPIVLCGSVTPDGKYVAGSIQGRLGRTAVIWDENGNETLLNDNNKERGETRIFSPNGKKLLYLTNNWATFDGEEGTYAIYDLETKQNEPIFPVDEKIGMDIFGLSDNNTVMGEINSRGYIYTGGEAYYADNYLEENGVDLSKYNILVMDGTDYYNIYRSRSISADDNVMGFWYYNDGSDDAKGTILTRSMIVKFNQETTGLRPASIKASQVKGTTSVSVTWKPNVAAKGITGYNIYRDDNKISTASALDEDYVDTNVTDGDHTYAVTALYGSDESAKSDLVNVTVASNVVSTPTSPFAKQFGYNSAKIEWGNPQTNFGSLSYYDLEKTTMETFGIGKKVSYETAIRLDSEKLKAYKGEKIVSVGFMPLEAQGGWKINLYTYDDENKLQLLYSQPVTQELQLGQRNVVKLDEPQDIPEGDLLVATEVAVNNPSPSINKYDNTSAIEGYTDLLRQTTEADFYSVGEIYKKMGYQLPATWTNDVTFAPENADMNHDVVDHYNVYVNNNAVGSSTENKFIATDLSEGDHELGVSAVFADGKESAINNTSVNITPNEKQLKPVESVEVNSESKTAINAKWEAPVDNDNITLQYSQETAASSGVTVPDGNDYSFTAAIKYTPQSLKGRDGYIMRSVRFYPTADAAFTAKIFKNSELVSETEIDDYTLNQWNEVELDEPVTIDANATYYIAIDMFDAAPNTAPLGNDNKEAIGYVSDLYSYNGGSSWDGLISNTFMSFNWMIGANIESPVSVKLPVTGYDVTIDGEKKASKIADTSYAYDFGTEDANEHTIQVDVYYNVKPTSVSGGVTRFTLGTTGISANTIGRIAIAKGDNEITVSGDGVQSVQLVSTTGATVAAAKGNTVSLNGVTTGTYIVKAVVNGKNVTRKIIIE